MYLPILDSLHEVQRINYYCILNTEPHVSLIFTVTLFEAH